MADLREEIGVLYSLTGRIERSRMMWAGHVVWMEESRPPKGADAMMQPDHGIRKDSNWVGRTA